jgi:TetR/AcrR family transcriptional regulator, regulator of cefoperazone and chloramphenicol sensitivity
MRAVRHLAKPMEPSAPADPTRAKLLEAARHVFAERGFYAATVREICMRAGANVAAVNYHFHDKLGLYTEVLQQSVRAKQFDSIRETLDSSAPAEETLRAVIRIRLQAMRSGDLRDCQFRIMAHEFAQPTPAMTRIINKVSRPVYDRFLQLVGQIIGLPPGHEKTRLCVHSIMGQIMLYVMASPVLTRLWPELKMTPAQLDRIADHIADFSLAYLRGVRSGHEHIPRAARARRH